MGNKKAYNYEDEAKKDEPNISALEEERSRLNKLLHRHAYSEVDKKWMDMQIGKIEAKIKELTKEKENEG